MATVSSESLPETKAAASITDSETAPKPQAIYRCKRCRRIVASEENIVPHERGKGEQCFKWNKKSVDSCKNQEPPECSSIFVEPMKWMQTGKYMLQISVLFCFATMYMCHLKMLARILKLPVQEGFVGEKLQCMGCKARLGSFNWAGMQCNCGTWINPAFLLHKNKLDECHV
uniref:Uncharacterized protein n=1 Tax=Salix viminalis TaxID=40686 RepID=A0A6N2N6L1_SALVM